MSMEETRGRSLIPQSVRTPLITILFWSRAIVDWTVPAILRSFFWSVRLTRDDVVSRHVRTFADPVA